MSKKDSKMSHFYDYFYDLPPKTNQYLCNTKLPLFDQKLLLSIEHKCDPFEVILVPFLKISKGIIKSYTPIGVPLFLSIQN